MNDYMYIMIGVLFFVIGAMIGVSILLVLLKETAPKEPKPRKKKEKKEKPQLLKNRLGEERESWTEYNCIVDEVDAQDVILKNQKKEDSCYHYTKRKRQS